MKKINLKTKFSGSKRSCVKDWDLSFNVKSHEAQLRNINQLYMNNTCSNECIFRSQLKKKLNSYKHQDEKKHRYNEDEFITIDRLLELLVISKLNCYYCKTSVFVLYNELYDKTQWTLDRIDNSIGHNRENCVISCLNCNVQRRVMDDEKFKFSKQMKIIKNTNNTDCSKNIVTTLDNSLTEQKRIVNIVTTKTFQIKKL